MDVFVKKYEEGSSEMNTRFKRRKPEGTVPPKGEYFDAH